MKLKRKILVLHPDTTVIGRVESLLVHLGYQPWSLPTDHETSRRQWILDPPDVVMMSQPQSPIDDAVQVMCRAPVIYLSRNDSDAQNQSSVNQQWRVLPVDCDADQISLAIESALLQAQWDGQYRTQQRWLSAMIRHAPTAMLVVTADGCIAALNAKAASLLGSSESDALGQELDAAVHVLEGSLEPAFLEALRRAPGNDGASDCGRVIVRGEESQETAVNVSCTPIRNDRGNTEAVLMMLSDQTPAIRGIQEQQRHLDAALSRTWLLESILGAVPTPVVAMDRSGRVVYCSKAAAEAIDQTPGELIGRTMRELGVSTKWRKVIQKHREQILIDHKPISGEAFLEVGEKTLYFDYVLTPVVGASGRVEWLVYTACDVTQRKAMERQLLFIAEQERRRLAQELHDGLNQHLLGITLFAHALANKLRDAGLSAEADDAKKLADLGGTSIEEARRVARGLCPLALERTNLVASLENLAREAREMLNIKCETHWDNRLIVTDRELATQLYRIAQEAINNAVKHGKAKNIRISLLRTGSRGRLVIEDDGHGFDKAEEPGDGLGLQLMQYRAGSIRGQVRIDSRLNKGTMVTCTFEMSPEPVAKSTSERSPIEAKPTA